LIELAAFVALVFTKSPAHFIVSLVIQSLGSGASPALSSLRLMFASPEGMGRLMGAMNVLTTIISQLLAPVLFNYVFLSTIDTFPEAIFVVAAGLFGVAFVAMLFVRVRWPHWSPDEDESLETAEEPAR
jgi:MFS family permease